MTEYKLVVVGGKQVELSVICLASVSGSSCVPFDLRLAGGVGKSALTIQLIQNQ